MLCTFSKRVKKGLIVTFEGCLYNFSAQFIDCGICNLDLYIVGKFTIIFMLHYLDQSVTVDILTVIRIQTISCLGKYW